MQDYLTLGSTPCDESCAQVGTSDYTRLVGPECKRLIALLKKVFGAPPTGVTLGTKAFPHDFGIYYEVCVFYDIDIDAAVNYAFLLEGNMPTKWADNRRFDDSRPAFKGILRRLADKAASKMKGSINHADVKSR